MPDPGDPNGSTMRLPARSSRAVGAVTARGEPTPAKPWRGLYVNVPGFVNGCTVIAAVALRTTAEQDAYRFAVVFVDNGSQGGAPGTLVAAIVSFGACSGYRVREKSAGLIEYGAAMTRMLQLADLAAPA